MQAIKCGRSVRLISRNGADFTRRFPEMAEAFGGLEARNMHLDGELVAMDEQGRPSFQILQGGLPLPKSWNFGDYAFDLLHRAIVLSSNNLFQVGGLNWRKCCQVQQSGFRPF